jgi:hypothetical protein
VKLKKTLKPSRPGKKTQKNPKNHWAGFFLKKTRVFSNPAYDEEFFPTLRRGVGDTGATLPIRASAFPTPVRPTLLYIYAIIHIYR